MAPVARTVAVLAYPGMSVFETGIVTEVFDSPAPNSACPGTTCGCVPSGPARCR